MWLNNNQLNSEFLPGNYSGDINWQQSITMNPGDTFYLRLDDNQNNFGDFQYELINVNQTSLPEPASVTIAVFSFGCIGLILKARQSM